MYEKDYGYYVVIMDSALYKRVESSYKSAVKKFGNTKLYFYIDGKDEEYMNSLKVEPLKDKKIHLKLFFQQINLKNILKI